MNILNRARIAGLLLAAFAALSAAPAIRAEEAHTHMAQAADVTIGTLTLSLPYAIATLPNQPAGGGFLTITNTGSGADRLVAVTSPMAAKAEVHEMKMDGDVMKMSALPDGLVIPAGETVTLAPGGFHLMFMDLTAAFVKGGTVPVTLTFEKAGEITIELPVLSRDEAKALAAPMQHNM